MVEDGDKKTDAGDTIGEGDNSNPTNGGDNANPGKNTISALDEAKAINEKKEQLLDREEKLTTRKEKLHAEQMVGGHTVAGESDPKQKEKMSDVEYSKKMESGEINPFTDKEER